MKKFFMLAAFIFAVTISSTALAADWVLLDTTGDGDAKLNTYVDKDSIKRGIHSERYGISRDDGFSVHIKMEFPAEKSLTMINLVGFYEDNGEKFYLYLDELDANGNPAPEEPRTVEPAKADGSDGLVWPKVFDYVQKNLK